MPPKASSKSSGKSGKISVIRFIYLYLITAITFIVFIIGAVTIVDTGLKTFVFDVDEYEWERPMIYCEKFAPGPEGAMINNPNYEDCMEKQEKYDEEKEEKLISNETARKLSIGIAQVVVAFPLWLFHWGIIERDRKEKRKK